MQKENDWSANRGYLQHLDVLKRISSRKPQHQRKFTLPKQSNLHHEANAETNQPKGFERSSESTITKFKDSVATFRDQQILWENYYLGKRIIETPPVISKRKLDEDYQKHRRLVECLTSSSSRRVVPNEFRVKKLQEYKENVEHHLDERTLQTATTCNLVKVQISSLAFYRQRPALDNLDLLFTYATKSGKTHKQSSERFPADEILEKYFYFGISKRLLGSQQALTVEIRNLKGLTMFSIGHFSFPSAQALVKYQAQLFHCGKPIGQVEISTSYTRRAHLRTTQGDFQG